MNNRPTSLEVEGLNRVILSAISNTKNTVPGILKSSFYFKSRKSVDIAEKVMRVLSNECDYVLDPFLGGGSFLIAALNSNRYMDAIELDNYTYYALEMLFKKYDPDLLERYFNEVAHNCKKEILNLYRTRCCGEQNYISKLFFDPDNSEYFNPRENRDNENGNIHLSEQCKVCGKKRKDFDEYDMSVLSESKKLNVDEFPRKRLIENSRINITTATGADRYEKRFTTRNQYALLKIQENISKLNDSVEKQMIQHVLVSILARAKVVMYGSGTDNIYHIILNNAQDDNVWLLFEQKFKKFIEFKERYADYLVKDLNKNSLFSIKQGDYHQILKDINKKYDLIYSDFPYTDQVPYLERHQLFRVWLEHFVDKQRFSLSPKMLDQEIVVTNANNRQEKDQENYYKDLDKMFESLSKVLKANKYAVFTVKLGTKKYFRVYSEIINLARKNGLDLVTRVGLEKNDPTLRKQSAYKHTLMKDQVLVLKKLNKESLYFYIGNENYETRIIEWTYNLIKENQELDVVRTKNLTQAVSYINDIIRQQGHILNKHEIERVKRIIEDNFIIDKGQVFMDSENLYLSAEDNQTLFMKIYNQLPIYIEELLKEHGSFVLEDLYLKLTSILCESDNSTILQILEDDKHTSQIEEIINMYCDVVNERYVLKKIVNEKSEGAQDISTLTGVEFERLIEKILIKEGYYNIYVRGGAGDRGVDIIAHRIENNLPKGTFFIQCKRWVANVGSQPMQRLFAEREHHKAKGAICVTTSNFTSEGIAVANQHGIQMWNGKEVLKLLQKHFPDQYYHALLVEE